jgi:hypothetical protein
MFRYAIAHWVPTSRVIPARGQWVGPFRAAFKTYRKFAQRLMVEPVRQRAPATRSGDRWTVRPPAVAQ